MSQTSSLEPIEYTFILTNSISELAPVVLLRLQPSTRKIASNSGLSNAISILSILQSIVWFVFFTQISFISKLLPIVITFKSIASVLL